MREFLREADGGLPVPSLIQIVAQLPRGADGRVREDALRLVAENQIDLVEHLSLDAESRRNLAEARGKAAQSYGPPLADLS